METMETMDSACMKCRHQGMACGKCAHDPFKRKPLYNTQLMSYLLWELNRETVDGKGTGFSGTGCAGPRSASVAGTTLPASEGECAPGWRTEPK